MGRRALTAAALREVGRFEVADFIDSGETDVPRIGAAAKEWPEHSLDIARAALIAYAAYPHEGFTWRTTSSLAYHLLFA